MTLRLTPEILKGAYELLAVTQPFDRWNLPDSDDVDFRVTKRREVAHARLWIGGKRPIIDICEEATGQMITLLVNMSHEMVHLHETRCKIRRRGEDHHGREFRKWAAQVCRHHGYDLKAFF